ncbi:hypothetical protein PM082_014140 [Marasmius tenuissimus]|nr:hypothetical protein PM082_014140 [Marasmius tenuissimus]
MIHPIRALGLTLYAASRPSRSFAAPTRGRPFLDEQDSCPPGGCSPRTPWVLVTIVAVFVMLFALQCILLMLPESDNQNARSFDMEEDGEESELLYRYQDPLEDTLMRGGGQNGMLAPDPDIYNPPPPYSDDPPPNDDTHYHHHHHHHHDRDQHHFADFGYEHVPFSDIPGEEGGRHDEPYQDHCSTPE